MQAPPEPVAPKNLRGRPVDEGEQLQMEPPPHPVARPAPGVSSSRPGKCKFVIYHGEGVVRNSNGPYGTQVRKNCPQVVKYLQLPHKTFKQVQHWMMEMFQLNEKTHKLTVQHIVPVNTPSDHHPSYLLVDIVGDDSWMAFLKVAYRIYGYFPLYVQWKAKKSGDSGASDEGSTMAAEKEPAVTTDEHDGSWPDCKHGKPCTIETGWNCEDPGRRFYRCPLFADPLVDCGFTQWLDDKFPESATRHITYLHVKVHTLGQQVENLQNEVNELRRRHRKRSREDGGSAGDRCRCNKVPCDGACLNQDSQPRPCPMARLAEGN